MTQPSYLLNSNDVIEYLQLMNILLCLHRLCRDCLADWLSMWNELMMIKLALDWFDSFDDNMHACRTWQVIDGAP